MVKNSTFISDHPTLFTQIDDSILCTTTHSTPNTPRRLHTRDFAAVEMYLDKLRFKFSQNNIPNRVIELIQVPQEQWQPEHTLRYNNLDTHHQTDVNIREKVRAKEEFKL